MNHSKFVVSSAAFAKALAQLVPAVSSRPIIPITENVLIVGTGSIVGEAATLKLVCSNLETTLSLDLSVECFENFACCIPARKLLSTLKGFPDCPLTCELNGTRLDLKAGRSLYKLAGEDPIDFPKVPALKRNAQKITLPVAQLRAALAATLPFTVANDSARPYTGAVLIETTAEKFSAGELRFVSTDMNRVAIYHVPVDEDGFDEEGEGKVTAEWTHADKVLVPRNSAQLLLSLLDPKDQGKAVLLIDEGTVRLEAGGWVATRMDQNYPLYRDIIPAQHSKTLDIDRAELQAALGRLLGYTPEVTNVVVLNIAENGDVVLQADSPEWGNEGREELKGDYEGEAFSIGFSAQHLVELLKLWPDGQVRFSMDQPNRSAVLTATSEEDCPVIQCLVAPRPVAVAVPA